MDPGHRDGIPYALGNTGFVFNADRIVERMPDAPLDSWALLFDPEVAERFRDGGVAVLDAPGDVVQGALICIAIRLQRAMGIFARRWP